MYIYIYLYVYTYIPLCGNTEVRHGVCAREQCDVFVHMSNVKYVGCSCVDVCSYIRCVPACRIFGAGDAESIHWLAEAAHERDQERNTNTDR